MNLKKIGISYLIFYLSLLLILILFSLFNLTGFLNINMRKISLFIILNLYYFVIGFLLNRKQLSFNIYFYGIPVIIINYLISLFIKSSFIALLFLLINYLCFSGGIMLYRIIKKTNR